jgi:hypothetical protein
MGSANGDGSFGPDGIFGSTRQYYCWLPDWVFFLLIMYAKRQNKIAPKEDTLLHK